MRSVFNQIVAAILKINLRERPRSMRLRETLPLGERKFLALIEVEGQKFLLGATGNSLSLLARLSPRTDQEASAKERDKVALEVVESWR